MPQRRTMPYLTATLAALIIIAFSQTALASSPEYEQDLINRVRDAFTATPDLAAAGGQYVPVKCGTPIVSEVRWAWPDLTENARTQLSAYVQADRPDLPEYYDHDTPAGSFRIHYTRTGIDSVNLSFGVDGDNVPIYVIKCAALIDTMVQTEIIDLGYPFPISDSTGSPGEDFRYDIYLMALPSGWYGATYWENIVTPPGSPGPKRTSYMELHHDFTRLSSWTSYRNRPFAAMAVTLAHEFNHAIQYTYDSFEAEFREYKGAIREFSWFDELTSTYIEDAVFDYVNDYVGYLRFFFEYPWLSLRTYVPYQQTGSLAEQIHCYAACLWFKYLAQEHGDVFIRRIWDKCGAKPGFNTFEAIDETLQEEGTSLEAAWAEFLVWNYFSGARATDWSYEEGPLFAYTNGIDGMIPDSVVRVYSDYPLEAVTSPYATDTSDFILPYNADELGATYLEFIPGESDSVTDFRLLVESDDYNQWLVVTAGLKGTQKPDIAYTQDIFNPVTVENWAQYDAVLVMVSPFNTDPIQEVLDRNLSFTFAVRDSFSTEVTTSAIAKVYSNPLRMTAAGDETFQVDVALAEPTPVSMYIYTPSGQLVMGGPSDGMFVDAGPRTAKLRWAGTNRDNARVASGIYLALVKIGDKSEVVKVAVINR